MHAPESKPASSDGARRATALPGLLDDSLLVHLLLSCVVLELAVFRLAIPVLAPEDNAVPPYWHQVLSWVGLFLFYFASAFAVCVLARVLYLHIRRRRPYAFGVRIGLVVAGGALLIAALLSLVRTPSDTTTFVLDAVFTVALITLVVSQLTSRGDLGVRVGLVLLATPLVIHFYAPFALRFIDGDLGLPDRVQIFGQWSLVFAALATPYCFAPRPFSLSAARLPPLVVAMFVAVVGSIIVRRSNEVGIELAKYGVGVDLTAGAPTSMWALYIMALAAVAWTLVSCLAAESPARRLVGAGLGLVLLGGYGFSWPLQYLVGFIGLLIIGSAATRVAAEEKGSAVGSARSQPIGDQTWQAYVAAVVEALRASGGAGDPSAVSVRGAGGVQRTHVVWRRGSVPMRLTAVRAGGRIQYVDVLVGAELEDSAEPPSWTMRARPSREFSLAHPEPPASSGKPRKLGDPDFDRRFQVRDSGDLSETLLDAELRERAVALIDGWIAVWPERSLRFRVLPGVGAPTDHPIPISELAVRGASAPPNIDRLLALLALIADIGERALAPPPG